jgi:FlaA1/EpsC-like NDP-sugar epimerase
MTPINSVKEMLRRFPILGLGLKAFALAAAPAVAYVAAFLFRFDSQIPVSVWGDFVQTLPILVILRASASIYCGLHRPWWRFVSVPDLWRILKSVAIGSVLFAIALFALNERDIPRSVRLLEPTLTFLVITGLMVTSRVLHPGQAAAGRLGSGKRVLIAGAGETGNNAARELRHHPGLKYKPIGFVDDDPHKQGGLIQGVPVLGTLAEIPHLVRDYGVEQVVIAMPSTGRRRLREVVDLCKHTGVSFGILPATTDLIQGHVTVNRIRDVRIEDLLGRRPVRFDLQTVEPLLQGSVVCVTGAGGSIGSELCRQLAACAPERLLMIDRNENNLHYLYIELAERFPNVILQPEVADITERPRMSQLFAVIKPRILFHAAAFKHVPLMEASPCEAVKNNVTGTRLLAEMASEHGFERFVMISTDKAINPTSVMGATKRVAELLIQGLQHGSGQTRFMTVRFGNVLGSEGSVVPIFRRQIERGGPVTVTHPNVVRFFMLVDEAVHLVLHSSILGEGGEIFLLDMGEPVRIIDLAVDMIRLSGFEPYNDIDIRVTGLRPGEKLYEELVTASEVALSTSHPKIMRLNEQNSRDWEALQAQILDLEQFAREEDTAHVREQLAAIVPEYQPALNGPPPHGGGSVAGPATSLASARKHSQRVAPAKIVLSRQAG